MNLRSVPIGKFSVSPMTHLTDNGAYRASVTISSGRGSSSHHRVYRFSRPHALAEAARLVALTQGWLQTCTPSPALC